MKLTLGAEDPILAERSQFFEIFQPVLMPSIRTFRDGWENRMASGSIFGVLGARALTDGLRAASLCPFSDRPAQPQRGAKLLLINESTERLTLFSSAA